MALILQWRIPAPPLVLQWRTPLAGAVPDGVISGEVPVPTLLGPEGPRGPKGDKGDTGDAGPKGDTGLKGDTGDTGPKGDTGLKGDTGDTGPKGDTGLKGDKGDQGAAGISALSGLATITLPATILPGGAGVWEWTETVAATGVTAALRIGLALAPALDADENCPEMADILTLSGEPGTDQITVTATFFAPMSGPIKLNWSAS